MGLAYIASALRNTGHEIMVYNQDVYHYPESHLTKYLNNNDFDVVTVSVIGGYYQYQKLLKLSNAINSVKNRPHYILGGHGSAPEPEYFLRKTMADAIVIGEGEKDKIGNCFSWIKANPTFEGLKQIIYEPDARIHVGESHPESRDENRIIQSRYFAFFVLVLKKFDFIIFLPIWIFPHHPYHTNSHIDSAKKSVKNSTVIP